MNTKTYIGDVYASPKVFQRGFGYTGDIPMVVYGFGIGSVLKSIFLNLQPFFKSATRELLRSGQEILESDVNKDNFKSVLKNQGKKIAYNLGSEALEKLKTVQKGEGRRKRRARKISVKSSKTKKTSQSKVIPQITFKPFTSNPSVKKKNTTKRKNNKKTLF